MGLGTDLVDIPRMAQLLERHRDRFLTRCFRPGELPEIQGHEASVVAGRWAAKEAFLKALGTTVKHIPYRDIEVRGAADGPVSIVLHGLARETFDQTGGARVHLSISLESNHALAVVIIET
jgi:holo-[acyl-carrier protein] synthase